MTLLEIENIIKEIDVCMLYTSNKSQKKIEGRPMLTIFDNSELKNIFFFCMKDSNKVKDLEKNNTIALAYQDNVNNNYIHIDGKAEITTDISTMQSKWDKKLNTWWQDEAQTKGICMIKVTTQSIRYWTKNKNGVISLN